MGKYLWGRLHGDMTQKQVICIITAIQVRNITNLTQKQNLSNKSYTKENMLLLPLLLLLLFLLLLAAATAAPPPDGARNQE